MNARAKKRSEVLAKVSSMVTKDKSFVDLGNFNSVPKQAFFQTVTIAHMIVQGAKAESPVSRGCMYRVTSSPVNPTLYCALGFWIPDDRYDPSLEGSSLVSVAVDQRFDKALLPSLLEAVDDHSFLKALQSFHDTLEREIHEDPKLFTAMAISFLAGAAFDGSVWNASQTVRNVLATCFLASEITDESLPEIHGTGYEPEQQGEP